jgi:hypothetical protein
MGIPSLGHRVRLVMLVDSFLAGGAERVAVGVAIRLDRSRFDPRVIATRCGGPLLEKLDEAGVPYAILGRRRGFAPRKLLAAHREIANCDLLHAHKYGSNVWGALFARTTGVPLVVREPAFRWIPLLGGARDPSRHLPDPRRRKFARKRRFPARADPRGAHGRPSERSARSRRSASRVGATRRCTCDRDRCSLATRKAARGPLQGVRAAGP